MRHPHCARFEHAFAQRSSHLVRTSFAQNACCSEWPMFHSDQPAIGSLVWACAGSTARVLHAHRKAIHVLEYFNICPTDHKLKSVLRASAHKRTCTCTKTIYFVILRVTKQTLNSCDDGPTPQKLLGMSTHCPDCSSSNPKSVTQFDVLQVFRFLSRGARRGYFLGFLFLYSRFKWCQNKAINRFVMLVLNLNFLIFVRPYPLRE